MTIETDAANGAAGSAAADTSTATTSIDDTLESAYDAAMARHGAAEEVETGEPEQAAPGRQRAPDGKFLPAKAKPNGANGAVAPAQVAATPGEEAVPVTGAEVETPAVVAKPHDAAPNTWRKELATEFGKLPENVREEIHRREADFHKGITQYKEAAGFGTQMAQELLPYQPLMQQYGKQPREVVKEATTVWKTLVTGSPQEKANTWLQIAQAYGIDLSALGTDPPQGTAQPTQEDPRLVTALQRLEKLEGHLTSQERQRAEAEFSAHTDTVNKFGSDPKHEHFQSVREDMAVLIETGRAKDLDDAYDKAIWINPDVRAKLLAKQEKERADKLAAAAANARKAAGANVTRRGTPPTPPKAGKIEDTLERRYNELMS